MAFTYVTITHTFETAADVPAAGAVDFTPITPMHNGVTVVRNTVTAELSSTGGLAQSLAANTDPDTSPTGTVYQVTERITGQAQFSYYVQVPHDQGTAIDLRTLAGWVGGTGSGGGTVTTINSEAPDGSGNVTLSASDVGAQLADADLTGLAALGDGVPRRASGTWGLVTGTPDGTKFLRDDGTWASASGSSYTDEQVRDVIGTALVAGSNVTITPNDGADTITISAATSGASGIPASTVDAKGDLIAGTADDTVARRSVGTNGQALLADSAQTTGLAWGAPVPADNSVTNAKVDAAAAISADKLADGTTNKVMTATERTKLAGLATIATSGSASDLAAGTVPTARLGSGTANSATYLRGDQTWGSAPSGIPATVVDAKGDLLAATADNTVARLAVGSNGQVLTADSAQTSGLRWATLASSSTINVADYGAVGNGVTNDTTAFQNAANAAAGKTLVVPASAAGFYQITAAISVSANTRIIVDENATIRQATKFRAVWDVFNANDVTIIGGKYRYEGGRGADNTAAAIGRGGNDSEFGAAVWTNSDRTTIQNINVYGFECGVSISGWVGANGITGAITTAATEDVNIDGVFTNTVTFPILATGTKGVVIKNVRGNYVTDYSGDVPSEGHMVYFSDSNSARHQNITLSGVTAYDGIGKHAVQLKNVDGGNVDNIVARNCPGLFSLQSMDGVHISRAVSYSEAAPSVASIYIVSMTNCVMRDVFVKGTHGVKGARFDGTDCVFDDIRLALSRSTSISQDTSIDGTRNVVRNLRVINAGATPWDSVFMNGTDCVLENPFVSGNNTAIAVLNTAVRPIVNYDPGMLSVVDPNTVPPVVASGGASTNPRVRRSSFSTSVTLGGAGQIDTITCLQTHRLCTINGSQGFTMTAPAHPFPENQLTYVFMNTTAGAMGTITWNSIFHLGSTFTGPGAGGRRSITFYYDGTAWREISRSG